MTRRVKFITTGHAHLVGSFSTGDTFTGDAAFCQHLVDAGAAQFADPAEAPEPQAADLAADQSDQAADPASRRRKAA